MSETPELHGIVTFYGGKAVAHPDWFDQKRVILGVTGGIACYKACEIARELGRKGAIVQVVMTEAATAFVSPLTFQALTGRAVRTSLLDAEAEAGMGHIELARWADLILIAPCTANTLATLAAGQAPDLLTSLWLASSAHKAIAPAMNQAMWGDDGTQTHVDRLTARGITVLGPDSGIQACGDVGAGRMVEPVELLDLLLTQMAPGPLEGIHAVITAGPTHEPIDPVRYIANRSSGKMGFALATEAVRRGASVDLITGPVHLATPRGVRRHDIETALQMYEAVMACVASADLFIGAAAVSDMRPATEANNKLKKTEHALDQLTLVENPDIIASVAQSSSRPRLVVGFAAETEHVHDHGRAKLERKGLDCVIANDVSNGQVFGQDTTALSLIEAQGATEIASLQKTDAAALIFDHLTRSLRQGVSDAS